MNCRSACVALLVTAAICAAADRPRAHQRGHWNIEFIPKDAGSVSVDINNHSWIMWRAVRGRVRWYLPPQWANLPTIHVSAAAFPRGKSASIRVYWDDTLRQVMDFDADEDGDVSVP